MAISYPFLLNGIVPYREIVLPEKRSRGHFGLTRASISRCLAVPWGDYGALGYSGFALAVNQILGYSSFKTSAAVDTNSLAAGGMYQYISRQVPMPYTQVADGYLYAESLEIMADVPDEPYIDTYDDTAIYDEAILNVTFAPRPYYVRGDGSNLITIGPGGNPSEKNGYRYMSAIMDLRAKYQTLKPSALRFVDGTITTTNNVVTANGTVMTNAAIIVLCEGQLTITQYQVPLEAYPQQTIESLYGFANDGPIGDTFAHGSLIGKYNTEQLVLTGSKRGKEYQGPDGAWYIDPQFIFGFYPNGANKFFRENGPPGFVPGYRLATRSGLDNGTRIFPLANLNSVWDATLD